MIGLSVLLMVCAVTCVFVTNTFAQVNTKDLDSEGINTTSDTVTNSMTPKAQFQPVRTDSPRDTLETILRLTKEIEDALLAYQENQSHANNNQLKFIGDQLIQCEYIFSASMIVSSRSVTIYSA